MKRQAVALGFRVKSGWAAVLVLAKSEHALELLDVRRVELSDPRFPETRQPYHASTGKLETDSEKINRREQVVRCMAQQSLSNFLAGYRRKHYAIKRAAVVVGSQIDPATIANPHIRAHALEGCLFRSAVQETLRAQEIRSEVLVEGDAYACVAARLKRSIDDLKQEIQNLGRSAPEKRGPWRAEQKFAALAALFALEWNSRRTDPVALQS